MSKGGQRTEWHRNIAENFNRLSRAHERYRLSDRETTDRQTDRRQTDGRRHIANGNVNVSSRSLRTIQRNQYACFVSLTSVANTLSSNLVYTCSYVHRQWIVLSLFAQTSSISLVKCWIRASRRERTRTRIIERGRGRVTERRRDGRDSETDEYRLSSQVSKTTATSLCGALCVLAIISEAEMQRARLPLITLVYRRPRDWLATTRSHISGSTSRESSTHCHIQHNIP